ncbi:MAG: hypothetical protein JNM59_00200 [Hyphomonadaceae bacterium]|nr:hypothetical protein [Hyphomonadaceae bacterium]
MSANEPDRFQQPGALSGVLALIVAGLWIAGAAIAAVVLLGPDRLADASLAEWGALIAAIVLPALMALFSGLAARDSAHARAEARRLAEAAERLMNPERSADEAARQLAQNVRGEIHSLDNALENTLARLQEVEGQIARQVQVVDEMAAQAKAGANRMITGMERERQELLKISQDLTHHAQSIGGSIAKHTHAISEAARVAEAEVRAADQALDHRLTSFGAAAALINDRTSNLSAAAQTSADSALRLEQALSNALEILAKATNLTDAARQSAEAASLAANSTAGAVRETTNRAIEDAQRAADMIRGEAVNVEREAALALDRLRDAADAARDAALDARAAVEEEAAPAMRRARTRSRAPEPREDGGYDRSWRDEADSFDDPPQRPRRRASQESERRVGADGNWTWRDLLSDAPEEAAPAMRREARDPVAHLRRRAPEPAETHLPIVDMIERAGVNFDAAFSPSALERIAQRARAGTQARRRAVQDAAPDSARQLAAHLSRDPAANLEAMEFLRSEGARIAELIGRGRAAMDAEATRAFLLIDAAAG